MKKILFFLINFCYLSLFAKPLLVVICMVKNEADVIVPTLQPFVDAGVNAFFIFDTGSVDHTQEKVKDFFAEHNLMHAYLEEEPFINFATSRNHALERAEKLFPQADFFIMIDAEWYLNDGSALLQFCKEHLHEEYPAYLMHLTSATHNFRNCALLRPAARLRYKNPVHEAIVCDQECGLVTPSIYFVWNPSRGGEQKSQKRLERDLNILLKSYEENPYDPRIIFYLAQTYSCMGNFEQAFKFYNIRLKFPEFPEERALALYRLGLLTQNLARKDPETYTWQKALDYYFQAYNTRPQRIEPIIMIAQYYLDKQPAIAYIFAKHAVDLVVPFTDSLVLEREHYEFKRYELLACASYYVQDIDTGIFACQQALKAQPNNLELKNLLSWYLQTKMRTNS